MRTSWFAPADSDAASGAHSALYTPTSPLLSSPRSTDRLERGSAKAEVAGAIPAVDAISQDCGVTSSISPCEGDGPGANPGFLTILTVRHYFRWAEVDRLSSKHRRAYRRDESRAVRVRFPAWECLRRSPHLPINLPKVQLRAAFETNRTRFARWRARACAGNSRSSTAIEHPGSAWGMWVRFPSGRAF